MLRCAVAMIIVLLPGAGTVAFASAWNQPEGAGQVIAEVSLSRGGHIFGDAMPLRFSKTYIKDAYEYGVSDSLTIFSIPQYASIAMHYGTNLYQTRAFAFEGGLRQNLLDSDAVGVVSAQLSYRRMGASTVTLSSGAAGGSEADLRILYGQSFSIGNFDGFVNAEAGWRRTLWPRPNEAVADITAGLRLGPGWSVLLQSFNTVSAGYGSHLYTSYRQNKAELSVVRQLNRAISVQAGIYTTPSGRAVVAESGFSVAIWINPAERFFGK